MLACKLAVPVADWLSPMFMLGMAPLCGLDAGVGGLGEGGGAFLGVDIKPGAA